MGDPIALAVPVFFVLITIEILVARRRGLAVYRFTDALTDLSCGITSQVVLLLYASAQLAIYDWVHAHASLVTWPRAWMQWALAFVGVDFLYYGWHRMSHEVGFLWAAHVVHHQSEDYNLAVALRQAVLTSWTVLPFYLPLAVLGVPTLVYAASVAASTLYQFWIHTQLVGHVRGPLGWILNLPAHHRVHHAVNPRYLDKNHGAILIVWDRLFGTYADETEAPVYGIVKPLDSFDPLWAQVQGWVELAQHARRAEGLRAKIAVWFLSPAALAAAYGPPRDTDVRARLARPKYDRPLSRATTRYVAAQYGVLLVVTFVLMMWHARIPTPALVLGALGVLGGVAAVGGLVEGKRWARPLEVARLVALAGAGATWVWTLRA